jgi:tetratricopeptide (TPR) repeat protein
MKLQNKKLNEHYDNLTKAITAITDMYECAGQWSKAISILQTTIELISEFEKNTSQLQARLGDLLWKTGSLPEALTVLEEAKAGAEITKDQDTLALILYNLGEVYYIKQFMMQEEMETDALDIHLRALDIRDQISDQIGVAHSLSRIGVIFERLGDDDQARRYYERAINLCDEIDYPRGKNQPITHIGAYYGRQGEKAKALEYYQQALAISQKEGCAESLVFHLINVGGATYEVESDLSSALEYCQQALAMAESMNFKLAMAQATFVIGSLYESSGELSKARKYYERTMMIAQPAKYQGFLQIGQTKLDLLDKKAP